MKFLIIFLLLTGICFAEEFKKDKFDAEELTKEIEASLGVVLTGKDQAGYMNTAGDKIEVKLKDRELTQEEKNKINAILEKHNPNKIMEEKNKIKKDKENKIKQKLNLNDNELQELKELLK